MPWKALHKKLFDTKLGQTQSGKDIQGVSYHHGHSDFTHQDHADAAQLHSKLANQTRLDWIRTKKRIDAPWNIIGGASPRDLYKLRSLERLHDHHVEQSAIHGEAARRARVAAHTHQPFEMPTPQDVHPGLLEGPDRKFLFWHQRKLGNDPTTKDLSIVGHHTVPVGSGKPGKRQTLEEQLQHADVQLRDVFGRPPVRDVLPLEHAAIHAKSEEPYAPITQVVSVAVLNSHGQLLMGRRNDSGKWTMPGGHVDDEDGSLIAAAHRELKEETGFDVAVLKLLGSRQIISEQGAPIEVHAYKTFTDAVDFPQGDPDGEVSEWKWINVGGGLPEDVAQNLHAKRNVTLYLLGIQPWETSKSEPIPTAYDVLTNETYGEDLTKNLKGALMGGAMAALGALAPQSLGVEPPAATQQAPSRAFHPQDRFLDAIKAVESTGGRFTAHQPITKGLHAGFRAIGDHGLMPLTAQLIAKKASDPKVQALAKLSPDKIATALSSDPKLAHAVAREHAEQLHSRFGGNVAKMAYAWFKGPNAVGKASPETIQNHWYTKRFHEHFQKISHAQSLDPDDSFFREADHPIHRHTPFVEEIEKAEQLPLTAGESGSTPEDLTRMLAQHTQETQERKKTPTQKLMSQYFHPETKPGDWKADQIPDYVRDAATNTTPVSNKVQASVFAGQATPAQLYRSYKHSPHTPGALFLKYLIYRHQNHKDYLDPKDAEMLDKDFLDLHQKGGAADKNHHLDAKALHYAVQKNPGLIDKLLTHRDRLQQAIKRGVGLNVKDIHGEPHVALTRGLSTSQMGPQHALSSWSDLPDPAFGFHMHRKWVPLKNLWYTFKAPYKASQSPNYGHENEFLVSSDVPTQHAGLPDASGVDIKEADLEPDMLGRSGDPLSIPKIAFDDATREDVKRTIRNPNMSGIAARHLMRHAHHIDSDDVDTLVHRAGQSSTLSSGQANPRAIKSKGGARDALDQLMMNRHPAITAKHLLRIVGNPEYADSLRRGALYQPAVNQDPETNRRMIDSVLDSWEKGLANNANDPLVETLPIAQKNHITIEDAKRVHRGLGRIQQYPWSSAIGAGNTRRSWLQHAPVDDEIVSEVMGRADSSDVSTLLSYKGDQVKPDHIQKLLDHPNTTLSEYAVQFPNATSNQLEQVLVNSRFDQHTRNVAAKHPNVVGVNPDVVGPFLSDRNMGAEAHENLLRHPGLTDQHLSAALARIDADQDKYGKLPWDQHMMRMRLLDRLDLPSSTPPQTTKSEQTIPQEAREVVDQIWTQPDDFMEAARFLAGAELATDDQINEARRLCDSDEEVALHAYGLPCTNENLKELHAIVKLMQAERKPRRSLTANPFDKSEERPFIKRDLDPAEGITITHRLHSPSSNFMEIEAHKGPQMVGRAEMHIEWSTKTLHPMTVEVDKEHRRKGVASAMYRHAEQETGHKVRPSEHQTKLGHALWTQPRRKFGKAEKEPSRPDMAIQHLIAVPNKGENIVMAVNRGIEAGKVLPLQRPGKFSQKAFIVCDPQDDQKYVVKPDPHKAAPPKGMNDLISAPVRERSFYDLACLLHLDRFLPDTALAVDNRNEVCSVVRVLQGYRSIDALKKESPGADRGVLEAYRGRGDLHRWAVLDFIAGNVDRHGNNCWVSGDGSDIRLIDQGSTMADAHFDPYEDRKAFIPYYLRYLGAKRKMTRDEFQRHMPTIQDDVDKALRDWIFSIDPVAIRETLKDLPEPILGALVGRLERLRAAILGKKDRRVCETVNRVWLGIYN